MADKLTINDLFKDFAKHTREDWKKIASTENEGKDPDKTLTWKVGSLPGKAYYDKNDLPASSFQLSPAKNSFLGNRTWHNLPVVTVTSEKKANHLALNHLQNGADGILFDIRDSKSLDIDQILEGIEWPYCMISFKSGENSFDALKDIPAFIKKKNWKPETISGFLLW
ncbi:MAG TPA: hypothetical protein VFU05_14745, partial [Cyclobacteriaceae bacterium]|nr:hypothetical protein [Cyclobacteriaceae bacterium]